MMAFNSYQDQFSLQNLFTEKLYILIKELLDVNKIKYSVIEKRTKSIESFEDKVDRKLNKYADPLNEITDLTGIRIILYYQDDIHKIIDIISKEFIVDIKNSILNDNHKNPNEFGYSSTHLVIAVNKTRSNLIEWKSFKNLKAELQIRSVLQHAWASISHTLQYKSKEDIPNKLQRQLFRLAGLFELADEEFLNIRDKHNNLAKKISSIENIEISNSDIDILTLKAYTENTEIVNDLFDAALSIGFSDGTLMNQPRGKESYSDLVSLCYKLGITTIRALHQDLILNKEEFENVFSKIFNDPNREGNHWFTDKEFCIILFLISYKVDKLNKNDLIELGWGKELAERTLNAIKEKR